MAGTKYKIKGVEDNDTLIYIGSLFRHTYSADWHVQVRFKKSNKRSVLASLLPDLVIGRTYNRTDESGTESPSKKIKWSRIVAHASGKELGLSPPKNLNRNERYFILSRDEAYLAIPQLELARVLFLQNSKMFHYAIDPVALGIDFQYFTPDQQNLLVEVNDSAQLSRSRFNQLFNQSKLAYTLCDDSGKKAFLSIKASLLNNRFDKKDSSGNTSTWWTFTFDAPDLKGSILEITAYRSPKLWNQKKVFVVKEITGLTKIPNSLPNNIKFFSRDWFNASSQRGEQAPSEKQQAPNLYEVDDQATASSFLPERTIASGGTCGFSLEPKRNTESVTANKKIHLVVDGKEHQISGAELASTELPSFLGQSTPVVTSDNTMEEVDKTIFSAFKAMVDDLSLSEHLHFVSYEVRQLPKVGRSKCQNKKDGKGYRYAAIAHFKLVNSLDSLSLIEIDLSDMKKTRQLSTLSFKHGCLDEARSRADSILTALVAASLTWPTKYFKKNDIHVQRVKHPQAYNPLENDNASIELWTKTVKDTIELF